MKLLVVAPEPISAQLAGPNIRSLEIARQLAHDFDTTLAVPLPADVFPEAPLRIRVWTRRDVLTWLDAYDVVLSQGTQYPARGCLRANGRRPVQVFDLYNPLLFEMIAGSPHVTPPTRHEVGHLRRLTMLLVQRGDYFLCASPQQRDLWLGALYIAGRFTSPMVPSTGNLEEYVGIVPFGHDGTTPRAVRRVLKGVYPGIHATDKVILWGGGVWNWFDPLTLIRAMAEIGKERRDVKLFFMGTRRPDSPGEPNQIVASAQTLARDLGLWQQTVFFNETWLPFAARGDYLIESDVAVCTTPQGLENYFAFRTRLIDAIWAGVPIVCTREGFFGEYVDAHAIGLTARAGDVADVKHQIMTALQSDMQARFRLNLAACRNDWHWEQCVRPLRAFCTRVARGEYRRPPEPRWQPWLQYMQYKLPTMLEKIRGH